MSCQIIYNNQKYSIESFKDFLDNNKNIFLQEFISQDIEGFKEYVEGKQNSNEILDVYVNPNFVNEQHNKLPSSQRNDVEVDLSKDQKFFNEKKQITQQFTSLQKPKNVLQEEWDFLTEEEREKLNNCK